MKFRYRLERALQLSRLKESLKKLEIASAMHRIRFLETRKSGVDQRMREILAKNSESLSWAPYLSSKLASDLHESKELTNVLHKEQLELDLRREELAELVRNRGALESLREKRLAEHNLRVRRREQKQLDELFQLLNPNPGAGS